MRFRVDDMNTSGAGPILDTRQAIQVDADVIYCLKSHLLSERHEHNVLEKIGCSKSPGSQAASLGHLESRSMTRRQAGEPWGRWSSELSAVEVMTWE